MVYKAKIEICRFFFIQHILSPRLAISTWWRWIWSCHKFNAWLHWKQSDIRFTSTRDDSIWYYDDGWWTQTEKLRKTRFKLAQTQSHVGFFSYGMYYAQGFSGKCHVETERKAVFGGRIPVYPLWLTLLSSLNSSRRVKHVSKVPGGQLVGLFESRR